MSLMRIAIASPTSPPATATGCATSCPPRIDGVIIGPQQPGLVLTTMWPPSSTGPSSSRSGPIRPLVNVSTKTVRCVSPTDVGGAAGRTAMARVHAVHYRQRGLESARDRRLEHREALDQGRDGRVMRELDREPDGAGRRG